MLVQIIKIWQLKFMRYSRIPNLKYLLLIYRTNWKKKLYEYSKKTYRNCERFYKN